MQDSFHQHLYHPVKGVHCESITTCHQSANSWQQGKLSDKSPTYPPFLREIYHVAPLWFIQTYMRELKSSISTLNWNYLLAILVFFKSHRIHVWYICLHLPLKSTNHPMGMCVGSDFCCYITKGFPHKSTASQWGRSKCLARRPGGLRQIVGVLLGCHATNQN